MKTWIAVAILACALAVAAGVYFYRARRALPAASAGPAPDILSLLPPDAPVIAYFDVAALRNLPQSPLAALLGLTGGASADRDYADFVRDTGFDYTRDLDKAALALWPSALLSTPPSQTLGGAAENRVLVVADGRFDQRKIEAYALRSGKAVWRGGQSLYEVPGDPHIGDPEVAFEFRSPSRIALASGPGNSPGNTPVNADDLLLALAHPAAPNPAMQALVARVAGAPIFAVARTDSLPPSFYANFRNSPQLERMARSIQGLTLAGAPTVASQPRAGAINVTLDAECNSMSDAIGIATMLDGFRMLGSMALSDPKTRRNMTRQQALFLQAAVSQAKISHQDNWVRLSLDITPDMLASPPPPHQ